MTTPFKIYGNPIVLDSKNSDPIDLMASGTKSLRISRAILKDIVSFNISTLTPTNSVLYNNSGSIAGSTNFTYNGVDLYLSEGIKLKKIYGFSSSTTTDSLGYNEIYRGTAPQNCVTSKTTDNRALGTDVSFAKSANYVAYACPFYTFGASKGSMSIWTGSGTSFVEYGSVLTFTNFTLEANIKFCSINDDATIAVLCDGNLSRGNITSFTRSGSVWTSVSNTSEFSAVKLSQDKMISYDYNSNFNVHNWSGSGWNLAQNLVNNFLPDSYSLDYPMTINSTKLAYCYSGNVFIWTFSTSWVNSLTISFSAISIDYSGTVLAMVNSSTLRIYESDVLVISFAVANLVSCCTNGTYVFTIDNVGAIRIYSKISGTWTKSTNNTTLTSGGKMSCNANYLSVGTPSVGTYGSASIYQIVPYTNQGAILTTINMLDGSNRIVIDTAAGTIFNTGAVTISDTTESSSNITGCLKLAGGLGTLKNINAAGSLTTSSTGSVITNSGITDSSSYTTGSTILSGGIGVAKNIYTNSGVTLQNTLSTFTNLGTVDASSATIAANVMSGGLGIAKGLISNGNITMSNSTSTFNNTGTTATTALNTGCNIMAGGLSVVGKMFTNNTLSNKNGFSVILGSSANALASSAITKLTTYWTGSAILYGTNAPTYAGGSGEFTIAEAGIYFCCFSIMLTASTTLSRNCFMYVNGSGTQWANTAGYLPADRACNTGSAIFNLNIGDKISCNVFCTAPGSSVDTAVAGQFMIAKFA